MTRHAGVMLTGLLVLVGVAGCGGGGDGGNGPATPTGHIAFQAHRTGSEDIWVMREDGSNPVRITTDPADDTEPAFSADGTKIAFSSDRGGDFEVWVVASTGGTATPLTGDSGIGRWPSWHPSGSFVVYERQYAQTPAQIWRVGADGNGDTLLVTGNARFPAYSPDGTKLAWVQGGQLMIGNADGSNPVPVTTADAAPAWSPDGSQLAFEATQQIVVVNADGSGRRNLTNRARGNIQPAWSPDGTHIAFACDVATAPGDVNDEVCVLPASGVGALGNLTNSPAPDFKPSWVDP